MIMAIRVIVYVQAIEIEQYRHGTVEPPLWQEFIGPVAHSNIPLRQAAPVRQVLVYPWTIPAEPLAVNDPEHVLIKGLP